MGKAGGPNRKSEWLILAAQIGGYHSLPTSRTNLFIATFFLAFYQAGLRVEIRCSWLYHTGRLMRRLGQWHIR
jgi:hypothetical protein